MTHGQEGGQESESAEQEVASFKEELTQPPLNPRLKGGKCRVKCVCIRSAEPRVKVHR